MGNSKHYQDVAINIDGVGHVIHFDWLAIQRLRTDYGVDFEEKIAEAELSFDMETLAKVLAVGLARHHDGEITPEAIMRNPPPIVGAVQAVTEALNLAFHGAKEAPPENPTGPIARLRSLLAILSRQQPKRPVITD